MTNLFPEASILGLDYYNNISSIPSQEQVLVDGLKSKNVRAFNLFYHNYSAALFGVINRIMKDKALAEDLLQEAMIKIWNTVDSYDPDRGRFFTWIMNVSRNLAIDEYRSKDYKNSKRNLPIEDQLNLYDLSHYHMPNTDHIGIHKLFDPLEPNLRQIMQLVYFEGYTQVETAEHLGIPLGTVKTWVRLAIVRLRKAFTPDDEVQMTTSVKERSTNGSDKFKSLVEIKSASIELYVEGQLSFFDLTQREERSKRKKP